jgi:integrase
MKRTRKGIPQQYKAEPATDDQRRARRATVNRTLTILKAALNRAFEAGKVDDDTAWRRVKPFDGVSAARPGWLTIEETRRLVNAAAPGFRPIIQAALLTGAPYGELCAMRCRDFQRGKVYVFTSKKHKSRDVVLTDEGIAFFEAMTADRPPDSFIFLRDDGNPWAPSLQTRPMRQACENASIKPRVGIRQLRHTYASHAIMRGMPLIVLAGNLGHSSTVMVERHYGHLAKKYVDDVIKASAPIYGITAPSNVQRLNR